MPQVKAMREQFQLDCDKVTHGPTGAVWTAYSGDPQLAAISMGRLGSILDNGDEYDRRETHDIAVVMLEERMARR
ncbi:MAG: hypothetical protein RSE16_02170 [Sphingobium sp.]|nr:MAG: hypothetical protein RSE16_02170 [Sphingobium sp.]